MYCAQMQDARGGVPAAPGVAALPRRARAPVTRRPHAHEGMDIAAILSLRDPPFCLEDAMRSKLLLGLLALAACERVQPPVAPPQFDGSASQSGSGRIAFVSTRDGHYNIYVMNADGSGVTQLTTATTSFGSQAPAWCGTRIAYMTDEDYSPYPDVYVVNEDGSGETRLTIDNASFDEFPSWSPDCGKIAFTKDPSGRDQVFVMNADGSGVTQLTSGSSTNSHPAWSPDGSRIAFVSDRDWVGNSTEIYVMNADGTQQTRVTANSDFHLYDFPAWSSDAAQLAFQASAVATPGIYVMNADGSSVTLFDDSAVSRPAWFGP